MKQIINFVDVNADQCGGNFSIFIQVEGEIPPLTHDEVHTLKNKLYEMEKESDVYDLETNILLSFALDYLKSKGYKCTVLHPDFEIDI